MPDKLTIEKLAAAQLLAGRLDEHLDWLLLVQQSAALHEKVKVFEATIWFPRLQAIVNSTNSRGMSGSVVPPGSRAIKVMTWCCAGRCLIQLERGDTSITLITADDEAPWQRDNVHVAPGMGPMGIQSIDAEHLDALVLLYECTRYGSLIELYPDDNVTIGG